MKREESLGLAEICVKSEISNVCSVRIYTILVYPPKEIPRYLLRLADYPRHRQNGCVLASFIFHPSRTYSEWS